MSLPAILPSVLLPSPALCAESGPAQLLLPVCGLKPAVACSSSSPASTSERHSDAPAAFAFSSSGESAGLQGDCPPLLQTPSRGTCRACSCAQPLSSPSPLLSYPCSPPSAQHVVVVGAGVTGVLAAIYLARRGYNVQVRKQRLSACFRVCQLLPTPMPAGAATTCRCMNSAQALRRRRQQQR